MNLQMPMKPFIKQRYWCNQNDLFMNLMNFLIKAAAIVVVAVTFLSCNDDFSNVGSEVIGDVNFQDKQYSATPVAYNQKFDTVQTSFLPVNLLGVYNDPVYGQSSYDILSQVQPEAFNPDFGEVAVLDSVVFNLPYFSTVTATQQVQIDANTTETASTFRLDSVYGNQPIKLSIYKSNYFLRDLDPTTNERQIYYSNDIQSNFVDQVQSQLLYSNDSFIPSASEIVLKQKDPNKTDSIVSRSRVAPGLRIVFSDKISNDIRELFKTQFLDKENSAELSNVNNFRNYFRGIYLKAEAINNTGNLIYFNLTSARITLHYSFDKTDVLDEDGDGDRSDKVRDDGEYALTFSNNIVNAINTQLDPVIAEELKTENQDQINGERNLYLKGGDGSYAVIDLFNRNITNENGEEENELSFIKRQNWLVNDASLKFYIDQDKVTSGDTEPERIFIFNLETGDILVDYRFDATINEDFPVFSVINHLGRISRDSDKRGEFYKISLTQHIISVLNEDNDNVKLGLSVSQNVNIVGNANGFTFTRADENNPDSEITLEEKIIPFSSVISHEGTILYGNTDDVPLAKRLKLEIFYTESKSN